MGPYRIIHNTYSESNIFILWQRLSYVFIRASLGTPKTLSIRNYIISHRIHGLKQNCYMIKECLLLLHKCQLCYSSDRQLHIILILWETLSLMVQEEKVSRIKSYRCRERRWLLVHEQRENQIQIRFSDRKSKAHAPPFSVFCSSARLGINQRGAEMKAKRVSKRTPSRFCPLMAHETQGVV